MRASALGLKATPIRATPLVRVCHPPFGGRGAPCGALLVRLPRLRSRNALTRSAPRRAPATPRLARATAGLVSTLALAFLVALALVMHGVVKEGGGDFCYGVPQMVR